MKRSARIAAYIGIGALGGLLVALVAINVLTRTEWGHERARRFALGWLAERVHGTVSVSRISGRGLLEGVVLHDVAIVDARGRPFLAVDSVSAQYSWRTLVSGQIVLDRVIAWRPRVHLEQLPGDTAWNYQYLFADTTPRDTLKPAERTLVLFRNARIVDGFATVLSPVDNDGVIEPADTARMLTERLPGGLAKVMRFEDIQARLPRVVWEQPQHEGRLFEVQSATGRGFVFRDPLQLRDARGRVAMRDSTITLDFSRVQLPASSAALFGNVVHTRGQNYYDIQVDADRFAFADLGWIYPRLPEQGGGSARLRIQSQRALNSTLWLAENARIRTEGTTLAGSFGVVTGDTMYFTQVDLRASPLDVALIERLLPGGLPVEGLLVGTVEIKGPLSALETRGDLRFAGGASTGSGVRWRGTVDARQGRWGARSLRADLRSFDLAILRAFRPDVELAGRVTGQVNAEGQLAREVHFAAELMHRGSGLDSSWFHGRGVLAAGAGSRSLELEIDARHIALSELAYRYPALRGLQGSASGPVRVRGPLEDLELEAALVTRAGPVTFNGRLARGRDGPRYQGEAQLSSFELHTFFDRLPEAKLSGAVAFDLTGTSLDRTRGMLRVQLDSAVVARVPLQKSWLEARLADGLLHVDTLHAATLAGDLSARGALGLDSAHAGSLAFALRDASVGMLEADLLGEAASTDAAAPRLAGAVRATGELRGNFTDLAATAEGDVRSFVLGPLRIAHGSARLEASALGSAMAHLELGVIADSAAAYGHVLDAARLTLAHEQGTSRFRLRGGPAGVDKLLLAGVVTRAADTALVAVHELQVREGSAWRLADTAYAYVDPGQLRLSSFDLARAEGEGRLNASGVLAWGDSTRALPVDFRVALAGMPFTDVLRLTRSRAEGAGRLDGSVRVTGTSLDPFIDANLTATQLAYNEVRVQHGFAELGYAGQDLELFLEAQHGSKRVFAGGGSIPLDLRFLPLAERRLDRPLNLSVNADSLPAAQVLPFLDGFSNVEGWLNGTVRAAGTPLDPALSGEMRAERLAATWAATGVRYSDFNGLFRLVSDRVLELEASTRTQEPRRRLLAGDFGAGTVRGRLDFTQLTDPAFDLRFDAERVHAAERRDVEARITGAIHLGGHYTLPVVDSALLRVDGGTMYLDELYRQFFVVQLDSADMFQFVDTSLVAHRRVLPISKNPFLENLDIRNAQVSIGNGSWLRSTDLDVEVVGELTVAYNRGADDLRMTGALDVVRGTYQLAYPPLQARRFQVRSGTIEFPGIPGIDPNLNIEAVYKGRARAEPLDIIAQVNGSLQAPRVRLTSNEEPPISESDLASYLFFGVPTYEVGNIMGTQNTDTRTALAGTLAPSILGYAASGLQTLAQGVGLLDYVSLTTTEQAAGTENDALTNPFATAQLDLGRYITPDVYVGVSQRLAGSNRELAGRLEWRFSPTFTLELFAEDRFARNAPSFGYNQEALLKRVYGFFLFREWGY